MSDKLNYKFDICFSIYIIISLTIFFLDFKGFISFGHGLGDVFYLGIIFLIDGFLSFIYLKEVRILKRPLGKLVFIGVLLAEILIVILMYTIFRGPEAPWNGNLFLR